MKHISAALKDSTDIYNGLRPDTDVPVSWEKEEFMNRVMAMSQEDLQMIVDYVPVEMCLARIQKELDRVKAIESSIKETMNLLK